jgi:hypothetical protein
MLLRMAVMTGLISGTAVAKFYATVGSPGSASRTSLEDYLATQGVETARIEALKRAYAETSDFGTLLLQQLRNKHVDEAKIRGVARALNACETAQLMALRKCKTAKPIGEMMVELGHVSQEEVDQIVQAQAVIKRVDGYEIEARARASLAGRLGLLDAQGRLHRNRLIATAAAVCAIAVAIAVNVVVFGNKRDDTITDPTAPQAIPKSDAAAHARMLRQHYGNMLTELRMRNPGNAEHYRRKLLEHARFLTESGMQIEDAAIRRMVVGCPELNFARLSDVNPVDLARMTDAQLEARMR